MTIDVKCTKKSFQSALIWDQVFALWKKKDFFFKGRLYSRYWRAWKKNCAGHVEFVKNLKYEREMFLSSLARCDMYIDKETRDV